MVNKGKIPLDLAQLSDGQRSVLAMVSDLCKRLCQANPQIDPLSGEGVVLIDELELHLHPTWQREIVEKFRRTFPRIQFITTTHSPFVIQSLRPGELVNLEPEEFEWNEVILADGEKGEMREVSNAPATTTLNYSDNSIENISEELMGVKSPQKSKRYWEMVKAAEEYYALLDVAAKAPLNQKEKLKTELDEKLIPYENDAAFVAFLKYQRGSKLREDAPGK